MKQNSEDMDSAEKAMMALIYCFIALATILLVAAAIIITPTVVRASTTSKRDCPSDLCTGSWDVMHEHLIYDQDCKHFCDCAQCDLYHVIAGPEHMGDPAYICPICHIWHEYRNGTAFGTVIYEHVQIGSDSYAFFFGDTGDLVCGGSGEPDAVSSEDGQAWNTSWTNSKKAIINSYWGTYLTHVPEYMMAHHENMTGSYFCGDKATILHRWSYYNNPSLSTFEVDDATICIEQSAFRLSKLYNVSFGESLRYILDGAFSETMVDYLKFDDKLRWIGNNAFAKCLYLRIVLWGKGDVYLGKGAFAGDKSLSKCKIDKHIRQIWKDTFNDTGVRSKHERKN